MEQVPNWANDLSEKLDEDTISKNKFDIYLRCLSKIMETSPKCEECQKYLTEGETLLLEISSKTQEEQNMVWINFRQHYKKVLKHLEKEHKFVLPGHFLSIWISLGMMYGVTFGIIFNNLAIGISIGMALGISIGSSLDAKAKKDEKVI